MTGGTLTLTRAHYPSRESGLDPSIEEVSWVCWELRSASPARLSSEGAVQSAMAFATRILESTSLSGRTAGLTELVTEPVADTLVLRARLALAVFGSAGTTLSEATMLAALVHQQINSGTLPYRAEQVDPRVVLDIPDEQLRHTALIKQRKVRIESDSDVPDADVLARWYPPMSAFTSLAQTACNRSAPTRVRAAVTPTALSMDDLREMTESVRRTGELVKASEDRPDIRYSAERGLATAVDLTASFSTMVFSMEVSVSSPAPLEELFLRHVGSCFTSELDVIRRPGHTVVAAQRMLLGGFDIERQPAGLPEALRAGLPMRGGMQRRRLSDLVSLAECPLGWPLPLGGPIPTIPAGALRQLPVPSVLRTGVAVGRGMNDVRVHLPLESLARHAFVCGATGTGKTTVLVAAALHWLRSRLPFLLVDWHGPAAEAMRAWAYRLGVRHAYVDTTDGGTSLLSLLPKLRPDGSNLSQVEQAVGRFVDSVISSLPDKSWAGPRFKQIVIALLMLAVVHGVELCDSIEWVGDPQVLLRKSSHALLSRHHANVLRALNSGTDGPTVRDWATSKLHPFMSLAVRRVIGRPGEGDSITALVRAGRPIILNLAGMTDSEAQLVGHLIVSAVLESAMDRPEGQRAPYLAVLDEAQKLAVAGMQRIQTEGRKFGISLFAATQTVTQLDPVLADIASSAAVQVAFRQTPNSAAALSGLLDLPARDLIDLPDMYAYVKVVGHPTSSAAIDPYEPAPPLLEKLPPRDLAGKDEPGQQVAHEERSTSFLDEWLDKRRSIAPQG